MTIDKLKKDASRKSCGDVTKCRTLWIHSERLLPFRVSAGSSLVSVPFREEIESMDDIERDSCI